MVTDTTEAIDAGDYALPPSMRWTMMFWRSACRGRTGSARPRLIGFALYLCDRRQTILFDEVFSTVRSLSCGVPQGSVLGPLLFLHYTADQGELAASLGLSSHFYADDSQLYTWDLHQQLYSSGIEWS